MPYILGCDTGTPCFSESCYVAFLMLRHIGQVWISVDSTDQVNESNEGNNSAGGKSIENARESYQTEWESAHKAGMLTRVLTGYEADGGARYAVSWRP
jgi:hypothetical protein